MKYYPLLTYLGKVTRVKIPGKFIWVSLSGYNNLGEVVQYTSHKPGSWSIRQLPDFNLAGAWFYHGGCLIDQTAAWFWSGSSLIDQSIWDIKEKISKFQKYCMYYLAIFHNMMLQKCCVFFRPWWFFNCGVNYFFNHRSHPPVWLRKII